VPLADYAIATASLSFLLALGLYASGVFTTQASSLDGLLQFDAESRKVTRALGCRDAKITPPLFAGDSRLYGCIMGAADTAKYFTMWNNWRRDLGYGAHADRREAIQMVRTFAQLYATSIEDELVSVFQGTEARSYVTGQYRISYRWDRGPGIDEHLLILEPR
jgi:hypothetical protein